MKLHAKYYVCAILFILVVLPSCTSAPKETSDPVLDEIRVAFLQAEYERVVQLGQQLPSDEFSTVSYQKAYYYYALSNLKLSNYEEARSYLTMIKLRGKNVSFLDEIDIKIAESYLLEGKFQIARDLYQTFITNYPDSQFLSTVYYRIGKTSQKLGRFSEAQEWFTELETKYPLSFETKQLHDTDTAAIESFCVQVGSFYDYDNAKNLERTLKVGGYDASILKTRKDNALFYRVRVGSFSTRGEAQRYEQKLANEGYDTLIYP